jgi:predicted dehydrogenase
MSNRRAFLERTFKAGAAMAATGLFSARRVLGANDRVRVALIGAGGRGQEIFKAALRCANTEGVAVADVYTRRLDEVQRFAPSVKTYQDFRRLLEDKSIDAVLIATPQHQHALSFVPAVQAGKDVFQEKTMAFNPNHANRMKKAFEGSGRVVQIGIQSLSSAAVRQVSEHLSAEKVGTITQIHTHHYRNAPYGGWKRALPPDCDSQHVDWQGFQGEAQPRPFDPNRVINWRFYWDYSGGNVYENMVHQVGFWYKLLDLQIPQSVTMTGGNYLSPEMEVPDTMDVSMEQPEKILFTWNSMFGNRHFGEGHDLVLGNKGTIIRDEEGRVRFGSEARSEASSKPVNQPLPRRRRRTWSIPRTLPMRTCRISSIASAAAKSRIARSRSGTGRPSLAAWPSIHTAWAGPCAGTLRNRTSPEARTASGPQSRPGGFPDDELRIDQVLASVLVGIPVIVAFRD